MKYLGIDYGARNIGIAITDSSGLLAFPHAIIPNNKKALTHIAELMQKEGIGRFIMGSTRTDNGTANTITHEAERFVKALSQKTSLPFVCVSESWSSYEAARYAPGKHHDDSVAASIILQRYIDMNAGNIKISIDEVE